jgi:PDZ domain
MPAKAAARAAAVAAAVVCSFAARPAAAKDPALLSLTPEHFRDTATLNVDPRDAEVAISTKNGFVEHSGPLHMVWHDEFLTALLDKNTGEKSFQVHAEITYSGNWRHYQTATYQAANGSRSVPTTQISKEVANCAVAECIYTEHVAFPVDEELLRQLAAAYVPGRPVTWSFRAAAKSGPDYAGVLSNAEITGLLLKVDQYTHTASVVAAGAVAAGAVAAAGSAGAPIRLDLGAGGMAVAATPQQPNRAGILIIAVTPGSVAQKSGIIVGDILFEIDGHAVKQPAELQAAVAACKADSAVPIRLYRGTEPITLSARF